MKTTKSKKQKAKTKKQKAKKKNLILNLKVQGGRNVIKRKIQK